jgi:GntR family transcriptional regulator / MocR family aminotransferase
VAAAYKRPKAWVDIVASEGVRPFQMRDPTIAEFPTKLWGSIAARRTRNCSSWLRTQDDGRGYRPLRKVIAHYLAMSRGVRCDPEQIVMVTGTQQALDLLAPSPEEG